MLINDSNMSEVHCANINLWASVLECPISPYHISIYYACLPDLVCTNKLNLKSLKQS